MKKLEARLCSDTLKVFELNPENSDRNYLGFAYVDRAFTQRDLENTALLLYSRTIKDLRRIPKIEVSVIY